MQITLCLVDGDLPSLTPKGAPGLNTRFFTHLFMFGPLGQHFRKDTYETYLPTLDRSS